MNILKTIRDKDVGSPVVAPEKFRGREASRAIVFDQEKKIALLHSTKNHFHKLPGGGVEEGEDIKMALRREVLEEIGCEIENIRELGIIEEYRNKFELHQLSYCFITDLAGEKGTPQLDEGEITEGFVTEWLALDDAITTLETETDIKDYQGNFIQVRDLVFLREAKTNSNGLGVYLVKRDS